MYCRWLPMAGWVENMVCFLYTGNVVIALQLMHGVEVGGVRVAMTSSRDLGHLLLLLARIYSYKAYKKLQKGSARLKLTLNTDETSAITCSNFYFWRAGSVGRDPVLSIGSTQ
ncbi:hypothetical protein MRX96_028517 [Rhipicephalus microplus]